MAKVEGKHLWPAAGAMMAAIVIAFLARPDSAANRVSTLDLTNAGFRDVYIQHVDGDRTEVTIGDRGQTTLKRGELPSTAPRWSFVRTEENSEPPYTWLARSEARGSTFFVPVTRISDWSYPYLYRVVRQRRKGLELPRVEWVNVFLDRIYQGLYLRVALPYDRIDADATETRRRELLLIRGEEVMRVDTWFEPPDERYGELFSDEALPELEPPAPSLSWLSDRLLPDASTVLVAATSPYEAKLLPLPIPLETLYAEVHGRRPELATIERVSRWEESWRPAAPEAQLLRGSEIPELESEFESYRDSFLRALQAHGELYGNVGEILAMVPLRQKAGAEMGLNLENP